MANEFYTVVIVPTDDRLTEAVEKALGMKHTDWPDVTTDVNEGYESPYRYVKNLRALVGDVNAAVFCKKFENAESLFIKSLYFAVNGETLAIYHATGS